MKEADAGAAAHGTFGRWNPPSRLVPSLAVSRCPAAGDHLQRIPRIRKRRRRRQPDAIPRPRNEPSPFFLDASTASKKKHSRFGQLALLARRIFQESRLPRPLQEKPSVFLSSFILPPSSFLCFPFPPFPPCRILHRCGLGPNP